MKGCFLVLSKHDREEGERQLAFANAKPEKDYVEEAPQPKQTAEAAM